jgi:hypothetical protein
MSAAVSFSEIPKAERKRLGAAAYRRSISLRATHFVVIVGSLFLSKFLSDRLVPATAPFLPHFGVFLAGVLLLHAIFWETAGRRWLMVEIEKLRNTS